MSAAVLAQANGLMDAVGGPAVVADVNLTVDKEVSLDSLGHCGSFVPIFGAFADAFATFASAVGARVGESRFQAPDADTSRVAAAEAFSSVLDDKGCAAVQRPVAAWTADSLQSLGGDFVEAGGGFGFGLQLYCGCDLLLTTGMGFGLGFTSAAPAAAGKRQAFGGLGGGGGIQAFNPTTRRELISVGGGGGGMLGGQCTVAADANTQVPPKVDGAGGAVTVVELRDELGAAVRSCPSAKTLSVIGGGGGGMGFTAGANSSSAAPGSNGAMYGGGFDMRLSDAGFGAANARCNGALLDDGSSSKWRQVGVASQRCRESCSSAAPPSAGLSAFDACNCPCMKRAFGELGVPWTDSITCAPPAAGPTQSQPQLL